MHKRNETATFNVGQLFYDVLSLGLAYFLAGCIYRLLMGQWLLVSHMWLSVVVTFVFASVMQSSRMYNYTTFYYFDRLLRRIAFSLLVSALFVGTLAFVFKVKLASRLLVLLFLSLGFVLVVGTRVLLRFFNKAPHRQNYWTRCLFIGNQNCFKRYLYYINKTDLLHNFVQVFEPDDQRLQEEHFLEQCLTQNQIAEAVIVHAELGDAHTLRVCELCESMGITVRLVADLFDMPASKRFVSTIGPFPVVTYHSVSLDNMRMFAKRVIDFCFSLIMLVCASPILLVTALAIRLESRGPVLFRQRRVGVNGKAFTMYKLRSMYIDAEERKKELMAMNQCSDGMMFKIKNDPRVTRVGRFIRKTSIDELPQLFNVLKGDMSLVGTRPPTLDEVEKYKPHHYRRISIKPGITGMWQVSGRSGVSDFEKVVELDTQYITNWSLGLDIKLLFRTVFIVLGFKNAY